MVNKTVELAKAHGWFMTRQFESEANPDIHTRTTAREILDDFAGERLDYWVTGYGTGGTLKGVSRVLAKERPDTADRTLTRVNFSDHRACRGRSRRWLSERDSKRSLDGELCFRENAVPYQFPAI
jgi:hypothetical protein